ncbi:hypothetical protein EVG20_g2670 [Dentipellis fragilis]|uniref:Mini-chromosome maintenance complex-binding protein n=1 Tax=Dentipellis fragilis TaxID=205917 RepID=A0A4Y9Z798_9AGAM|nr:hypothetical protein EVG20_g2670 [Dentipellis fragilis]
MVSSFLIEALASPTRVIQELWDATSPDTSEDFPEAVLKHFSDIFSTDDALYEIAPLDADHPPEAYPDRALVCFRAMVQDTSPSPEMYMSRLPSGRPGGWGVCDPKDHEGDRTAIDYDALRDCTVLWAVTIPGESEWYRKYLSQHQTDHSQQKHKASRPHKSPVPHHAHVGAQVKIYHKLGNSAPKTTDVVDFVGVLTNEPLHAEAEDVIFVPTVHVVFSRPHIHGHTRLLSPCITEDPSHVRDELISWIADEALGGDMDTAEWILLACISRVQSRNHGLNPLTLTVTHFPPSPEDNTTPTLSHVMSTLLPMSIMLPLSLEMLNTLPFTPENKNEDLHSGVLQVASGTTFLITEDVVKEGKLLEQGVLNVMAVQNVMTTQSLSYKFPFSEFTFPTDINFVLLSPGRNSAFFKADINITIKPMAGSAFYKLVGDIQMPSKDRLRAFRALLLHAKWGQIKVLESTSQYIQDDFVQERQSNKLASTDDLKRTISIARLVGLLAGEKELTVDVWKRAKALEVRRQARL